MIGRRWPRLALCFAMTASAAAVSATAAAQAPEGLQAPDDPEASGGAAERAGAEDAGGGTADAGAPTAAQRAGSDVADGTEHRPLRIAVAGNPPFVIERSGGELDGLSIDIWRAVAARAEVDYELTKVANASEAVDAVAAGRFDGAIGPISITSERAERVAFSQPYWQASLAIMTRPGSGSFWSRIEPFVTEAFFGGVAILLLVLTLVGTLLWVIERKPNDQFPKTPLRGIGVGIWLALVTMTTVGYGDKAPITLPGRILTGVWMVIAMLTASSLTAGIATALTLSQLDPAAIGSADELGGRPVAALSGTTGESFARRHEARVIGVPNVQEAAQALVERRADAVVFDRPILQYHMRQNPDLEVTLVNQEYEPVGYGFAFPLEGSLRHEVNVALLGLAENGQLETISSEWL